MVIKEFLIFLVTVSSFLSVSGTSIGVGALDAIGLSKDTERLRLYQLDAQWSGASVSGASSEFTWSVSPTSFVRLNVSGYWQNIADMVLNITLKRSATVVIKYSMLLIANKGHYPGGDFLNDGQSRLSATSDYVGARVVVDGTP